MLATVYLVSSVMKGQKLWPSNYMVCRSLQESL